jgi:hypothetical protein
MDHLAVVQFIHPGGERIAEGHCPWNNPCRPHARKFLIVEADRVDAGRPAAGLVGLWGEWEPPSIATRVAIRSVGGLPTCHHRPLPPMTAVSPRDRSDTDPFVFGERFLYNGCQQHAGRTKDGRARETFLRRLAVGSVVLFGSHLDGSFVLDTVLVVSSHVEYAKGQHDALLGIVPPEYVHASLMPQAAEDRPVDSFRLYLGATLDDSVDGMFSFSPCRPFSGRTTGFQRPKIELSGIVTQSLKQGKKMTRVATASESRSAWLRVVDQVTARGFSLAHRVKLPRVSS